MKPLHPTILIGYGRYGLSCLQALLAGAAARGEIVWDTHAEVAAINEKRLSALALFWIPDVLGLPEQKARTDSQSHHGFEMMEDLFAQIDRIHADERQLSSTVARKLETAKTHLFDEYNRIHHERRITVGLDVIVLAQVTHEGVIGKLREILGPAMKLLASDPGLASPGPGQDLLNFIQVLDFEDYWSTRSNGAAIRAALSQMIGAAETAVRHDEVTFGRTYLFDGRTAAGNHQENDRREEAVLLLDFLLFEGQRPPQNFRFLFQREDSGANAVCTVGVRAIEYSTGKLRRLAAASFARGWLEYLVDTGPPSTSSPLREVITPLLTGLRDAAAKAGGEDADVESALAEIRRELLTIDCNRKDWPDAVLHQSARLVAEMKAGISRKALSDAQTASEAQLDKLGSRIEKAITQMLVTSNNPSTVGEALAETNFLLEQLSDKQQDETAQDAAPNNGPNLQSIHSRFQRFQESQVQAARLKNLWWPLAAIALALAYSPTVRDFLASILGADWGPQWLQTLVPSVAIALGSWVAGVSLFHPRLVRSVERAQRFFTHSERGRLVDAIGMLLDSPDVRGELTLHARIEHRALRSRRNTEAIAELRRVRSLLAERAKEIEWLNGQLLRYLDLHGVEASAEVTRFLPERQISGVTQMVEGQEDLDSLTRLTPRKPAEFRDMQRKMKVLADWADRFCDRFLAPHRFLDDLGACLPTPDRREGPEIPEWVARVAESIHTVSQFPVSFYWHGTDHLPQRVAYAAVPSAWDRLSSVSKPLGSGGYSRHTTIQTGERLYLIQAQMGVPKELLQRSQA